MPPSHTPLLVVMVCGVLPLIPSATPTPLPATPSSPNDHQFSQAHFQFTLDLYLALVEVGEGGGGEVGVKGGGNLVFSPVGVASVLSPLLTAATDNISREVRQVLRYSNMSVSDIEAAHTAMMEHFRDSYYLHDLHLASTLLLQVPPLSSPPPPSPLGDLYPGEVLTEVDFQTNRTGVIKGIHQWVNEVSDGKVGPPPLSPNSGPLALLVVFFSGRWLHGFDRSLTFDQGLFYTTSQHRYEIPMMVGRLEVPLGYSAALEVRVLELPLLDRRASLFILLPDHPDNGLANFEQNITAENIKTLLSTLKDERVNIRVPRFRVEGAPPLRQALVSLGLPSLFPSSPLHQHKAPPPLIDNFIHSAACEVVEGDAPTLEPTKEPVVAGTFGDKYFEVDHPFIFFVWDYRASSILVMGRVMSPQPITLSDM